MSDHTITQLPTSEVKLEFTVSAQDAKPYLDEAVRELSTARPIPGFRPGKATYEEAKRAYGEMRIWETALERIVRSFYVRAVLDAKFDNRQQSHLVTPNSVRAFGRR
jgi:trigger factor